MPELVLNGCTISYQEFGAGVPVVLTSGGRWAGYVQRVLASELAKDFRVISWDRRNTDGRSDIVIAGDISEADIWAEDLAALISALGIAPCYVGEYAGCRTTPLLCLKHPELVKGLMLAWPSGGEAAAARLPNSFYRQYIRAALRQGMKAVAEIDRFAGSIGQRPTNKATLLAMEPVTFVRQMAYWETFFSTSADLPVVGCRATEEEWASIKTPAIVIGGMDPIHPTETAERLHRLLANSEYQEPVATPEEWSELFGVVPFQRVSDFQGERIAPAWRKFIKQTEARGESAWRHV
jgi:pimeloyl-ACP methyl ester carboxylesterase